MTRLPEPPRDLPGLSLKSYSKFPFSVGVQTLRGCCLNCAYCTYPYLQGRAIRLRSPKKVADEIEHLANSYGIREVYFADPIFNFPLEHARSVCRELTNRKLPINWVAYFREDSINRQFLIEARDSGCVRFEFSPDGASQHALEVLQKGISIGDIKRTCELINEIDGINANFNFFCNVPGKTRKPSRTSISCSAGFKSNAEKNHQAFTSPKFAFTRTQEYMPLRSVKDWLARGKAC